MKKRIILVGFAGCGKSTVGDYLINTHGFYGINFADSIKDVLSSIFCWDRAMLEGDTPESRAWRESVDTWWTTRLNIPEFTPRYAMRNIGSDILRKYFNDGIFRLNVEKRIEQAGDRDVVAIDGRFREEIDLVTSRMGGEAIRVQRGPEPSYWGLAIKANKGDEESRILLEKDVHRSEWDWIGYPFKNTIKNNGSLKMLHSSVDKVLGL